MMRLGAYELTALFRWMCRFVLVTTLPVIILACSGFVNLKAESKRPVNN